MNSPNAEDMTSWICKQFAGPAERDRVLRHMRIYTQHVLKEAAQVVEEESDERRDEATDRGYSS